VQKDGSAAVEDLGSRNGTVLRGQRLAAGERAPVALGEAIHIGSTVLMVQRRSRSPRLRRVWPHGYFEARIGELCELCEGTGASFAVGRVDLERAVEPPRMAGLLAPLLALADVLGTYTPRSYEILMPYSDRSRAAAVLEAVAAALRGSGLRAKHSLALFPRDGQTASAIVSKLAPQALPRERIDGVIVLDEEMRRLHTMVAEKIGPRPLTVLILGETGVGKEVLATAIQRSSPRASKPFLQLNCAAFPETLLESELFGHEKDAFTGAHKAKPGLLESADGGTVLLDEIGEMSLALQAKLLRAVESKQVRRLGALEARAVDVRFIAATHRDLGAQIRAGRFREDLYYRLNLFTLTIPPLRRRTVEIGPLADLFIESMSRQLGWKRTPHLTGRALEALEGYAWPGNVRELRNVAERAVALADEGTDIDLVHLPLETLTAPLALVQDVLPEPPAMTPGPTLPDPAGATPLDPRDRWNRAEREERARIMAVLEQTGNNQSLAAKALKMARGTLIARMVHYDLPRPRKGQEDE
jgi:two-component system response regulator AtoC